MAATRWILLLIFSLLAIKTDADIAIKADPSSPTHGQNVTITCNIPSFIGMAYFKRGDSSVILANCFPNTQNCVPENVDKYTFGVTSASIFVVISGVDIFNDSFPWICQCGSQKVNLTLAFNTGQNAILNATVIKETSGDIDSRGADGGSSSRMFFIGLIVIIIVLFAICAGFFFWKKRTYKHDCPRGIMNTIKEMFCPNQPDPAKNSTKHELERMKP